MNMVKDYKVSAKKPKGYGKTRDGYRSDRTGKYHSWSPDEDTRYPKVEYAEYDDSQIIEKPLWWHKKGLSYTASGYGEKIPTSKVIKMDDGRERRIYCDIYSNIGSCYIIVKGKKLFVRD